MELFKINIGQLTKEYEQVTGIINIQIGSFIFPEENWNDSVLNIIEGWSSNYINIKNSEVTNSSFRFMDGPFFFNVCNKDKALRIDFKVGNQDVKSVDVDKSQFLQELESVQKEVKEICYKHNW